MSHQQERARTDDDNADSFDVLFYPFFFQIEDTQDGVPGDAEAAGEGQKHLVAIAERHYVQNWAQDQTYCSRKPIWVTVWIAFHLFGLMNFLSLTHEDSSQGTEEGSE